MGDRTVKTKLGRGPDFNLLLIVDPHEPKRFRIEGTIRLAGSGDPYKALQTKLKTLLSVRTDACINRAARN